MLAYCGFQRNPAISLPSSGVNCAAIHLLDSGGLSLLWSEVEWPLQPGAVQQNAVEFHQVISHVFAQTTVIPFRLLTVFDGEQSLADFAASHCCDFVSDLERLKDSVQMECIIFFKGARSSPDRSSGQAYLRQKAELMRGIREYVGDLKSSLPQAREVRVKEVNNGNRIFCLLERGEQASFRASVESVLVPLGLERRISGPWPPAEFLSEAVKLPQTAGQK